MISEYVNGTTYFVHPDHLGSTRLLTGVGSNLTSNPGFESGQTTWSGWSSQVTIVNNPANAHSGSNYVQLSVPAGGGVALTQPDIAVQQGDVITFGGWINLQSGTGTGQGGTGWWINVKDANHTAFNWIAPSPQPTSAPSGWVFQTGTYTVPSGVSYVNLVFYLDRPNANSVIWADDGFLYNNRTSLLVAQNLDYLPFGELNSTDTNITTHKFTGDERDSETGLDHTLFRQYSSNTGNWLTPDPADLAAVDPTNPQSWNRYSYVLNNPLRFIDPSGLYCVYLGDDGQHVESIDDNSDSGTCGATGGYWIAGEFGGGANISINSDLGLVSGYGYLDGSWQYSVSGALNSNAWGAWTQTVGNGTSASSFFDISIWDFVKNPVSFTWLVPLVPFGPVASAGVGPTGAYNPRTDTGCLGLAAGAMVPAGGHSFAIGPLTVGDLGNADNVLAGGSVNAGVQSANPALGVQAIGNSNGILAGPTLGTMGASVGPSASGCKKDVGKSILKFIIKNIF